MTDAELIKIRDGFEARVDRMFRAEAGKPLVRAAKRPPLSSGRERFVRNYSWSIVEFAARCFYLDEQLYEANAALIENAQFYLDHPMILHDRDSYHWHSEMLCRFIELYGRNGTLHPGRLSSEAEDRILKSLFMYSSRHSRLYSADQGLPNGGLYGVPPGHGILGCADAEIEQSQTWHVHESENHHVQMFSTTWHFAKLAKDNPAYNSRKYEDGYTAREHYRAWTEYIKIYCLERAKKGLFIEMANDGYNGHLLKGMYNFYDFSEDQTVKKLVSYLLDLYWATWAQEQLDGVLGGGKARIYPGPNGGDRNTGNTHIQQLAWFYLGMGEPRRLSSPLLSALTSSYRLPLVVMDLALDTKGRGIYEVHQRPQGLAKTGYHLCPDYRLRMDYGGIHRYSYCTPEFIMGTPMVEARPFEDWVMISSQNRWHGVIFAGHKNARIVPQPQCTAGDNRMYNPQWSVQYKSTLIAQKLKTCMGCGAMRVWFSGPGLRNRMEAGGWVFVEAKGAYAAVRPAAGGYVWETSEDAVQGEWLRCNNELTPLILEVARKACFASYDGFCAAVQARALLFDESVLEYSGLGGDTFTFYADYRRPPEINGMPVDYAPKNAFQSPFVQAEWNSGVVVIHKDEREIIRDFNFSR